jgi:SHS2 domain-containing protein
LSPFAIIDTTADIGIFVWGADLDALFRDAARGMFSIIYEGSVEGWPASHTVQLQAPVVETLLVDWLSELLYLFDVKNFFFDNVVFEQISPTLLAALCKGTQIKSVLPGTEVKAVTHHLLSVDQTAHGFEANIYFDL